MDNSIGNQKTMGGAKQDDRSMGNMPTMGGMGRSSGKRFQVGDVILGRYRVLAELGQGGMGVVYRCFDDVSGIEVALKALPPEVARNSGEMEEVRENFRLVSKLHHPNIANVNTLERDAVTGDYYLIMECVNGYDIRQWARKRRDEGRALTLDEVVIIAYRLAEALDYAHEQKIIHRDIKPSNVRVSFEGEVKVLDFGLAAQIHTSMSRVSMAYNGTSGTGPYMAPEQWKGLRQGSAADQYALAATVYELLCGEPPFVNHDISILREVVLKEPVQPIEGMPAQVNSALLKALSKEPAQRFVSCRAFVEALSGQGVAVGSSSSRQWRTNWLWLAGAAIVVVASIVAVVSIKSTISSRGPENPVPEHSKPQPGNIVALRAVTTNRSETASTELDRSRRDAETWRGQAAKAKADADQARSATDAADLYAGGEFAASRAAEAFEKGNFDAASKAWQGAVQSYASAKTRALAVQDYRTAKTAFDEAVGRYQPLLEQHGKAAWVAVKERLQVGATRATDPTEGAKHYRAALEGLPAAVAEAQAVERQTELNNVLVAARAAQTRADWEEVLKQAEAALRTDPSNSDALKFKAEADEQLAPSALISATVAGNEIKAMVSFDSGTSNTTPLSMKLKKGVNYTGIFTYATGGRRYTAMKSFVADWTRERKITVSLEEVIGPEDGQAWKSPLTGMEFVWIKALKLWVGKYEVTNGEYKKKVPGYTIRDFRGQSLNGQRQPVVYVNFDDAKDYARWLTDNEKAQLGGKRYRVISEDEWQTAAQCGDGRTYPWGNSMPPTYGNYADSSSKIVLNINGIPGYKDDSVVTCSVERSGKNDWGIFGMGGNVYESCASDSTGSSFGAWRGAAWGMSDPDSLQCDARKVSSGGNFRSEAVGFRLVLSR